MNEKESAFSEEYQSKSAVETQGVPPDGPVEEAQNNEEEPQLYKLAKPRRIVIRAVIEHD